MMKSENDSINIVKKEIVLNFLLILVVANYTIYLAIYFDLWQFRCYTWYQRNLCNVVSDDFSYKLCE